MSPFCVSGSGNSLIRRPSSSRHGLSYYCSKRQCGRTEEFLQPDRQLADPDAGRVVDGVGDRCVGSDIAELTQALDAEIIDLSLLFRNEDHLNALDIGTDRDQVLGEVGIVIAGVTAIDFGRLVHG